MGTDKWKLLLVEDESDICVTAQSYFSKRNFIVSTTGSGHEALSMIKVSRPDIVLLDIALNDLSGVDMLKQLREYDQETKVIVITGQRYFDEEIEEIKSLGISGYEEKPLVLYDVERLVNQILRLDPPAPSSASAQKTAGGPAAEKSPVHRLSNLLGVIRSKCENFTLNMEEGIYKDKTSQELVEVSIGIMKDIQKIVDQTMEVVEQIKEK